MNEHEFVSIRDHDDIFWVICEGVDTFDDSRNVWISCIGVSISTDRFRLVCDAHDARFPCVGRKVTHWLKTT